MSNTEILEIKHYSKSYGGEKKAAVAIYMFPNMFVVMGLVVLVVILGMHMDHRVLTLIFTLIATVLAALSYARAMTLTKNL